MAAKLGYDDLARLNATDVVGICDTAGIDLGEIDVDSITKAHDARFELWGIDPIGLHDWLLSDVDVGLELAERYGLDTRRMFWSAMLKAFVLGYLAALEVETRRRAEP
jgi:hypothetical protein